MPTISDLKDKARALEQQGQIDKALNIYQHILKHLEGNPAITKVLPLYVKAGDLLLKMNRAEEAVASYQTGAEHYASAGAATRVTALCEKILRLAPERTDVYTTFVRLLIDNGHVGSARDVLAEYAQVANTSRVLETLNDLAGRPNDEVQPMLERLLESFESKEQDEQTAERVSSHLEQVTDDLAGELTGVLETEEPLEEGETKGLDAEEEEPDDKLVAPAEPEAEEPREEVEEQPEPLTPPMLDLDHLPPRSSLEMSRPEFDEDEADEADNGATEAEQAPEAEVTANVTPTMEVLTPTPEPPEDVELEEVAVSNDEEDAAPEGQAEDDRPVALEEPEAEECEMEHEPLTPPMLDLDRMPRQSSILKAISDAELEETADAEEDTSEIEQTPEAEFTTDVTPTMETAAPVADVEDEAPIEDDSLREETADDQSVGEDGGLDLQLAEAMTFADTADAGESADTEDAVEIDRSQWTPDYSDQSAEETVAAEWSPEEELQPAARYVSDEYETPLIGEQPDQDSDEGPEQPEAELADSDALDDEIARAIEDSHAFSAVTDEPPPPATNTESLDTTGADATSTVDQKPSLPPLLPERESEPARRPSRPPPVMMPAETDTKSRSPILFGIGGFVIGVLAGVGATLVLVGGGPGGSLPVAPAEQPTTAADTRTTTAGNPAVADIEAAEAQQTAPEGLAVDTPAAAQVDSAEVTSTPETEPGLTDAAIPDTVAAETEQPAEALALGGNPIIVEGLPIESITEATYQGRSGFRVVHLLESDELFTVESYRDTTISGSGRVTILATPSDTIVGIVRLEGYEIIASCVMPEDSLRSLMSRLVEGERSN